MTATLTSTQLTSSGWANIDYSNVQNFYFEASDGNDSIDILSTAATTSYIVGGDGGGDTFTVGNTTADFQTPLLDGSLSGIQGQLTILADYNNTAGVDTLNVDASSDANLAGPASITNIGSVTTNAILNISGETLTFPATQLAGFAAANIDYAHGDIDGIPNRLEFLNVRASEGNDTIAVNDTTATTATTIQGLGGNDTFNITGEHLSGANDFQGDDNGGLSTPGNDTFNLTIDALNVLGGDSIGTGRLSRHRRDGRRQRHRHGQYRYESQPVDRQRLFRHGPEPQFHLYRCDEDAGNLDIAPLFSGLGLAGFVNPLLAVQVGTTQTLIFNSFFNNDTDQITGTTANDKMTVAEMPTTAGDDPVRLPFGTARFLGRRFLDGTPYLNAPPTELTNINPGNHNLPGVSGGGSGPDLLINGISGSLNLDGGGNSELRARAIGDRLHRERAQSGRYCRRCVYGYDESQLPRHLRPRRRRVASGFWRRQRIDTVFVGDSGVTAHKI